MTDKPTRPELGPADLLVEAGQSFVEGWTIQRVRDYGEACVAAECARWKAALDPMMPADFKDWHQNSPVELPEIAAWTIANLREQREWVEQEVEHLLTKLAKLEKEQSTPSS